MNCGDGPSIARVPQALVGRDQLQYAGKDLSTHQGRQVHKIINDAIQSVLEGGATPQEALDQAQQKADALLSQFDR